MKTRSSNFELLRIIAIMLIIAGHLSSEGSVLEATLGFHHAFTLAVCSGARIAVNLFLMLGCWFMVDSKFSAKRILKLYCEVWFYSAAITLLLMLIKADTRISSMEMITSFLPFTFRTIWYASIYIMLLFLAPYLNAVFQMDQKRLRNLVVLLFVFVSVISTISGFMDTYLCALSWFVFIYFFMGYYKRFIYTTWKARKELFLGIGILMYLGAVSLRILDYYSDSGIISLAGKAAATWIVDYKSIPNFLCAFCIFHYFSKLEIKRSKAINTLAAGTFAAYIIHQLPAFRHVLWFDVYKTMAWTESPLFPLYYVGTVVSFFVIASLADSLRRAYLEKWWLHTKLVNAVAERVDRALLPEPLTSPQDCSRD